MRGGKKTRRTWIIQDNTKNQGHIYIGSPWSNFICNTFDFLSTKIKLVKVIFFFYLGD